MWRLYRVKGSSLAPAVKSGQLVVIRRRPLYQIGQIVAVQAHGRLYLKRLKILTRQTAYLEGDSPCAQSLYVRRQQLRGVLVARLFI